MSTRIYNINDQFFDVIDTQEKAYILGFFMADACNYKNNNLVKIDLSICDKYMLEKMAEIMEYTGTIKQYNSDTKKVFYDSDRIYECQPMARYSFRSKNISEKLEYYGCCSNKSKYGEFIKDGLIPEDLFNHYIRGLFDGNGGIYYFQDNENTEHLKFSINYCGTIDIVNSLAEYLHKHFGCTAAITSRWKDRDNNNLQFNICGNKQVEKILDWMYKDSKIHLDRKYIKYLLLKEANLKTTNDNNLYGNAYPRRKVINLETKEIFESVTKAARSIPISVSVITNKCKKRNKWMYLDEYEADNNFIKIYNEV